MKLLSPRSLEEALTLRAESGARIFAGGTDIFPERATRRGWGDGREESFVDLFQIPGLNVIAREGGDWRLGCLVTWSDLIHASLPPQFDGYRAAARDVGGVQIQNRGTLVGNICTASPAGDGIPCLIALEARVELKSLRGTRLVPISEFITARRRTACEPDEIVTALLVPSRDNAVSAFRKLGARRYLVISIAMASAVIETSPTERITRARVAVGACSEVAQRLPALEAAMSGAKLDATLADLVEEVHVQHLTPVDDMRSSAIYRREAAKQIVRELLIALASPQQAEAA
ncbi:FAD binding domain-containing protein [Terrarubrum flagellatum]|uniref:FAD binding domain-containing protein n=1 Tax=Terrirubrum flagellatum TaxID=2895980 RepID=UPI00314540F5